MRCARTRSRTRFQVWDGCWKSFELFAASQRVSEPLPLVFAARQAPAQPRRFLAETPDQNAGAAEVREQLFGFGRSCEPIKRRAAGNLKARVCQHFIKSRSRLREAREGLQFPGPVGQCLFADEQGWAGDGPWTEHGIEAVDETWRRECKAEPKAGEGPKNFSTKQATHNTTCHRHPHGR